ncbi:MAG: L-threonylcarbamoyladenylate synthase [Candidatus Falkowbacteria bacterium]
MKNIFSIKDIKEIVYNFKDGQVGIFPTDTVYGLGGRADKLSVIKKIYNLKKRDQKKPLLILVSNITMAKKYVKVNKVQEKFLRSKWPSYAQSATAGKPSALTVVLKSKGVLPKELTGGTSKIGVRLPDDRFLLKIIKQLNAPLIATSANISGQPSVCDVKNIKIKPDFIVDGGKSSKSKESTVVDLTNEKVIILRQGNVKI